MLRPNFRNYVIRQNEESDESSYQIVDARKRNFASVSYISMEMF